MNADDIARFIKTHVPTFTDIEVLPAGEAFHYTPHGDKIEAARRFLGAPLSPDLDQTQTSLVSPPATGSPGVVFAYAFLRNAAEEGFRAEVFRIVYEAAVRATHSQEAVLDAPPTILIASTQITSFQRLGPSESLLKR